MQYLPTDLPAAALEFCPIDGFQQILVCGTYKLEEDVTQTTNEDGLTEQTRFGKCLLIEEEEQTFRKTYELDFPGILDLKWCHRAMGGSPMLAVADSIGRVSILKLEYDKDKRKQFTLVQEVQCGSNDKTLALSIDWSNRLSSSNLGSIVTSLSDGTLAVLHPSETGLLEIAQQWKAHDFEPWIAAWNYWNGNVVYSGGDDLTFKGWDLRTSLSPTFVDKKSFSGGVTSIQSSPHEEYMLAVGSYDESVRIFDTRQLGRSVNRSQISVGGGAWRVKWHPDAARKHDILVACMHDGAKVVSFKDSNEPEVLQEFKKHESMAYGADWSFAGPRTENGAERTTIATCSFYDEALYIWSN